MSNSMNALSLILENIPDRQTPNKIAKIRNQNVSMNEIYTAETLHPR